MRPYLSEKLALCGDFVKTKETPTMLNFIQARVFCCHVGWGAHCAPPFLFYLLFNCHQIWHDSTMAQNLSKAVKVKCIMTSL